MPKIRLDNLLVERGLCESRSQAQALILGGKVRVDGQPATKAGLQLDPDATGIELDAPMPYVSRGGFKLEKALHVFGISPEGRVCLDIGASSGGFTDCLLQGGAQKVYAVDVGYGQLDWKLRQDERVVVMEKTNIRHVLPEHLSPHPSLVVSDASFISLKKILPGAAALMTGETRDIIALIKPQFEHRDYCADKNFKGVVRGEDKHRAILSGILRDLRLDMPDWRAVGLDFSPITGPKGNIEFLLHLQPVSQLQVSTESVADGPDIEPLIEAAMKKSYDSHQRPPEN